MPLVQDGTSDGSCEYGNMPSDAMKGGEFLDWLSGY
jgi:hypothetical protein